MTFYCFSHSTEVQKTQKDSERFIAPYAQKSSTVSNFEMSRRLACHVLLLSFLKNHRDHLLGRKQEKGNLHKCNKPLIKQEVNKNNQKPLSSEQMSDVWAHLDAADTNCSVNQAVALAVQLIVTPCHTCSTLNPLMAWQLP